MDEQLRAYLEGLYRCGHEHDAAKSDRLERLRNVEPDTAQLLALLVRALGARRLLELGTSNGYSTLWLADAARSIGGRVLSVDVDSARTAQAAKHLAHTRLHEYVELRTEDAALTLASADEHSRDMIFLDAERPAYPGYWPDLIRVLRPGGLLVVDNVLSHASEVGAFRELVSHERGVTEALVPTGAGALLIVRDLGYFGGAVADRGRGTATAAIRAVVRGEVQGVGFRDATVSRARELRVMGWVRNWDERTVRVHAEGPERAVDELVAFLHDGPPLARVAGIAIDKVAVEGHEQFAIRGVSAGVFVVREHAARAHHFDLRLEVDGVMRSWAIPKGPSLDPGVKRLAVEVADHATAHNTFEGTLRASRVIVWDRGTYEQGGRVAWPQALTRGHAVFVLHGEKLRGGFALQRTRSGIKAQWLLIKRRDEYAQPGSDVVAERPHSALSGRTLDLDSPG